MKDKNKFVEDITVRLENGIKNVFESDKYKKHLLVMSKFWNYSFNNQILITMQNPNATFVKGYKSWQNEFERTVKKGEKGIKILAPFTYKKTLEEIKLDEKTKIPLQNENGDLIKEEKQVELTGFKTVTVFDISQTAGKEIENLHLIEELKFNVENFNSLFNTLKEISPVPVNFENIENGAKGYYHTKEDRIAIKSGMSEAQTVKTLVHEIAHAKLHKDTDKESDVKELEAESTAFVVCSYFNIDTSDYSFGYLAKWSSDRELSTLKSSLDTIQKTSKELIEDIEKSMSIKLSQNINKENKILSSILSPTEIAECKSKYSKGDVITLEKMVGEKLPAGLKGIVQNVDDIGQIHIHWENGSTLAINPKIDKFTVEKPKKSLSEKINEKKAIIENNSKDKQIMQNSNTLNNIKS